MRLMLHACCGPCSLEPVRLLQEEGASFAICYANPNIAPAAEYERRLDALREFVAEPNRIELFEEPYDNETWQREVGIHGENREARCRACYHMRLEAAASRAETCGCDALATTLTISPYQYTQVILEELAVAADRHGLHAELRDFSSCYREATRRSRELGMYRQNYCGCAFSAAEAAAEREQRARERAAIKLERTEARIWAAACGAVSQPSQL